MGIPMKDVTKPRSKSAGEVQVQVNMRLTEYLRWKLYRYAKQEKIGQSNAVRFILSKFFSEDDSEGDWRGKKS